MYVKEVWTPIPKGKRSSTSSVRSRPGQALIKAEMHTVELIPKIGPRCHSLPARICILKPVYSV